MAIEKKDIVESLYKIMCSATSTVSDARVQNNDYFKRRVLGFRAEIEFEKNLDQYENVKFLEGGQLIFKGLSGKKGDTNKFIYITVSFDEPSLYKDTYEVIRQWDDVTEMIFVQVLDNSWELEDFETREERGGDKKQDKILKPAHKFYKYDFEKKDFVEHDIQSYDTVLNHFDAPQRTLPLFNLRKRDQFDYFNDYDISLLKKIYATRYFLDVVLRQASGRKVIDFDGFLLTPKGTALVEIKEKMPIKGTKDDTDQTQWKYGWDSRRILWYLYLNTKINLPVLYVVRHINNRDERGFVQWDATLLDDFIRSSDWSSSRGGGGGEDTILAPYMAFERLDDAIKKLES